MMGCRRRPKDLDLDGQPDERAPCSRYQSDDDEHLGNALEAEANTTNEPLNELVALEPPTMHIDQPMSPRTATPARYSRAEASSTI
jgi:hypothetical protein